MVFTHTCKTVHKAVKTSAISLKVFEVASFGSEAYVKTAFSRIDGQPQLFCCAQQS